MGLHPGGIVPARGAADGSEWAVLEHGIRRVDEGQAASAVVLQTEGKANDAEAKSRPYHDDMARPQCADQSVIDEAEPKVQRGRLFVVPERLRVFQDLAEKRGCKAEGVLVKLSQVWQRCVHLRPNIPLARSCAHSGTHSQRGPPR